MDPSPPTAHSCIKEGGINLANNLTQTYCAAHSGIHAAEDGDMSWEHGERRSGPCLSVFAYKRIPAPLFLFTTASSPLNILVSFSY